MNVVLLFVGVDTGLNLRQHQLDDVIAIADPEGRSKISIEIMKQAPPEPELAELDQTGKLTPPPSHTHPPHRHTHRLSMPPPFKHQASNATCTGVWRSGAEETQEVPVVLSRCEVGMAVLVLPETAAQPVVLAAGMKWNAHRSRSVGKLGVIESLSAPKEGAEECGQVCRTRKYLTDVNITTELRVTCISYVIWYFLEYLDRFVIFDN